MNDSQVAAILKSFLEKKKKERKGTSIRSLAQKLSMSSSYLHQIIQGERMGTPALYEELCRLLDVDPENRDLILHRALHHKGLLQTSAKRLQKTNIQNFESRQNWVNAPNSDFKFLKSWFFIPALECTMLKDYDGSAEFVAQELGLTVDAASQAMQQLAEAGYLTNQDGLFRKAHEFLDFNSAHSKSEIREFHKNNLELAKSALENKVSQDDVEQRLITSLTFVCKDEDIAIVKQKIAAFLQQISIEHASEKADHVYQLAVQFFPPQQPQSPTKKK